MDGGEMYNLLAMWGVLGGLIIVMGPVGAAWLSWACVAVSLGATAAITAYAGYQQRALIKAHQDALAAQQRQLEPKLYDSQQALVLAQANLRIKDSFFVGVSHQVRTSLTAILGYTELLLDDGMDYPQLLPDLDRIYMASKQLSTLMGDVFEISRHDAQPPTPEPVEFMAQSIADELSASFAKPCKARGNQLKIELEVEQLHIDRQMLSKLLSSMLTVSNNHTHNGQLVVRLLASEGQRLKVEVQDNGTALRREQLEVMATLNVMAEQDANALAKQMIAGLPLMLATRLCKALGGQFEVSAVAGEGNHLSATMPLRPNI